MLERSNIRVESRSRYVFSLAKAIARWGYRHLSHPVVAPELEKVIRLKRENPDAVFLYVSLHKSLWETTGIPTSLFMSGLPTPYVVMGSNLVRGKFFRSLAIKAGSIIIKRPATPAAAATLVREYVNVIGAHLRSGIDMMIFPEGTRINIPQKGRYGSFFPATFEALLEYEQQRKEDAADRRECYIIPCNVDYSFVRDAERLVRAVADSKPQTLKILDSLSMLTHIRTVYINFGAPIRVVDRLSQTRQELAAETRDCCLKLVNILPVNIVAAAYCALGESFPPPRAILLARIKDTVARLASHSDRFAGFGADTPAEAILEMATRVNPACKRPSPGRLPLFRIYRDYIGHFLPKEE